MALKPWIWLLLLLLIVPGGAIAKTDTEQHTSESLPYRIEVDITHQLVFVYSNSDDSIIRTMICSTGKSSTPTPVGVFYLPKKNMPTERGPWHLLIGGSYGRYATRITGRILFHSIPYSKKNIRAINKNSWNNLGKRSSLGCVRLTPIDAQWVAYNCDAGTRVEMGKPKEDTERRALVASLKGQLTAPEKDGTVGVYEATLIQTKTLLKVGSAGDEVRMLQSRLRQLGFFEGRIDGKYMPNTATAVERFQRALGLERTGEATPELQEMMEKPDVPTGQHVALQVGDEGPHVRALQDRLSKIALLEGNVDGKYGEKTQSAVEGFYNMLRIPVEEDATPIMQVMLFEMTGGADIKQIADGESAEE